MDTGTWRAYDLTNIDCNDSTEAGSVSQHINKNRQVESAKRSDLIYEGRVIVPLMPIASDGRTLLHLWLDEVASSSRVNMAADVFIATDPSKYGGVLSVARQHGVSEKNVSVVKSLRTGGHIGAKGELQGLAQVLPSLPPSQAVVILDGTTCCPDLSFRRLVEHALIRAKDTVAVLRPKPGPILTLEGPDVTSATALDASEVNPRIADIRPGVPAGRSDSHATLLLAPALVLQASTLPLAVQFVTENAATGTLGGLVAAIAAAGNELFGCRIGHVLQLLTFRHYQFVLQYLEVRQSKSTSLDVLAAGPPTVVDSLRQSEEELMAFEEMFQRRTAAADKVASSEMPIRFTNPAVWHNATKPLQHPCYSTSNSIYGAKVPCQSELPQVYHCVLHTDVTTLTHPGTGKPRFTGFVTSKIKSSVHKDLDEF